MKVRQAKREAKAAAAIVKAGGTVQWDENPPGPAWLRSLLGENFFTHVKRVTLGGEEVTDSTLEHLDAMSHLNGLLLVSTSVTDDGLERLKGHARTQGD